MVSTVTEAWWRRSFRQLGRYTLRALPIPGGQKWTLAGIVADRLEYPASPRKIVHMTCGFKMLVDLSESYERRIYYSGLYNPHLTHLFKQFLAPGDTVVDGGANIGYFSLLAAKCVGKDGHVHAFEPIPQTFETLNENIRLNGLSYIHTHRRALAEHTGDLCLEVPTESTTGNTVGRLATVALLGRGPTVMVPSCTLDEYATHLGLTSIKLVKLDIEGSEVAAIAGMHRLLSERRISYLICELNTFLLDGLGIPYSAMRKALSDHDYRCYYINSYIGFARMEHMDLVDISLVDMPDLYGDYLFAAPTMPVRSTSGFYCSDYFSK